LEARQSSLTFSFRSYPHNYHKLVLVILLPM
jgi:hypothetical protein